MHRRDSDMRRIANRFFGKNPRTHDRLREILCIDRDVEYVKWFDEFLPLPDL